jgi:hypothetical protein
MLGSVCSILLRRVSSYVGTDVSGYSQQVSGELERVRSGNHAFVSLHRDCLLSSFRSLDWVLELQGYRLGSSISGLGKVIQNSLYIGDTL